MFACDSKVSTRQLALWPTIPAQCNYSCRPIHKCFGGIRVEPAPRGTSDAPRPAAALGQVTGISTDALMPIKNWTEVDQSQVHKQTSPPVCRPGCLFD